MATKNVKATKGHSKKSKKTNKKDAVKMLIPLIGAIILLYTLYKIIGLIIVPTDIFAIENGTIFNEESATRICYKR